MARHRAGIGILVVVTAIAGCQHKTYRRDPPVHHLQPQPYYLQPGQPLPTEPRQPFLGTPVIPPAPSGVQPAEAELLLPDALPPGQAPVIESMTDRSEKNIAGRGRPRARVRLGRPIVREEVGKAPPRSDSPPVVARGASPDSPDVREEPSEDPLPLLPVGIPSFSPVYESVAAGERPDLDGLEWLRASGYTSILRLRSPDLDDSADRRLTERLGFTYFTIVLDPRDPVPAIERFNGIVNDPTNRPLFVYDNDGDLAGPLWFAHFLSVGKLPEAEALERASRLGLRSDGDGRQRVIMSAIRGEFGSSGS